MHGVQFQGIAHRLLWRMFENYQRRRRPRFEALWAQKIIYRKKLQKRKRITTITTKVRKERYG